MPMFSHGATWDHGATMASKFGSPVFLIRGEVVLFKRLYVPPPACVVCCFASICFGISIANVQSLNVDQWEVVRMVMPRLRLPLL